MTSSLVSTGQFLIEIVFNIFVFMVMLRFLLQWVKADFYNPMCQFLMKATNPFIIPLRRIIPGYFGLDFSAIVLMYIAQVISLLLMTLIAQAPFMPVIFLIAVIQLILAFFNLFFYAILIRAVASWFNPNPCSPMFIVLMQLTEPVLEPLRKRIPMFSGMDFSPLIALILLQVLIYFMSHLLM
jgi:YggT family protein